MSMKFDENSQLLATGTRNGAINIYNMEYWELETQIEPVDEAGIEDGLISKIDVKFPVTWLKWKPQSRFSRFASTLTASYGNGVVKFWDIYSKESKIKIFESEGQGIYSLDYNSTGSILATGGMDHNLRIYDEPTKAMIQMYSNVGWGEILNHYNRIFWVKFNPEDEHMIYSGGADWMITIHDIRWKFPIRNIIGPKVLGDSIDVRNHHLLTGSYSGDEWLEIWDLRNYERVSSFNWDNSDMTKGGQIVSAKFTKGSSNNIISASRIANEVRMLDVVTGETSWTFEGFSSMIYSLEMSNEGRFISTGNADGSISLFEYH